MYFICIYFSFINIIIDTRIIIIIMIVCLYVIIDYRSIRNPNKCIFFHCFQPNKKSKQMQNVDVCLQTYNAGKLPYEFP